MSRIIWDSERPYETGIDRGVLYISSTGVAWNGIIDVTENLGGEIASYWFDGLKILDVISGEEFALTLEAYMYPSEFEPYDGVSDIYTNQPRSVFGLSYRTGKSNGHKIHLVYNAIASPSAKSRKTEDVTPEPLTFSWDLSTIPVEIPFTKSTAHLVIDTNEANPDAISQLEELLYGTELSDPTLPTPEEVIDLFSEYATLIVVDHGDGTWTATGPDEMVHMIDPTSFEIISPSVEYLSIDTYRVSSY